jgi:hypothetical protein
MKRLTKVGLAIAIAGMILLLKGSSPLVTTAIAQGQNSQQRRAQESTRDAPPDTTPYRRPAVREDFAPKGIRPIPLLPAVFIVDAVVNNTDPNLTNTDTFSDGETSITANPANPNEVVVTAFQEAGERMRPLAVHRWREYLDQAIYNPCTARHSGRRMSL